MTDKLYAWLDLETTGSDERRDSILEIGIAISDATFHPMATFERVIKCSPHARDAAPIRVREMHDANGLWTAALASSFEVDEADREAMMWLKSYTDEQFILAGSGVGHFDSRFLRQHMPATARRLTYWPMDVGVIRRFLPLCGFDVPPAEDGKPHRALADALHHMDEVRLYLGMVKTAHVQSEDEGNCFCAALEAMA